MRVHLRLWYRSRGSVSTKGRVISTGDKGTNIAKIRRELAIEPEIQVQLGSVIYSVLANWLTAEVLFRPVRFARFQEFGTSLALVCCPCNSFPLTMGGKAPIAGQIP